VAEDNPCCAELNFKLGSREGKTSTQSHTSHSHLTFIIRFFKGIPKATIFHRIEDLKEKKKKNKASPSAQNCIYASL